MEVLESVGELNTRKFLSHLHYLIDVIIGDLIPQSVFKNGDFPTLLRAKLKITGTPTGS